MRRVHEDVTLHIGNLSFVTPGVEFDSCPDCGEQIFDLTAMEKINAYRPSASRARARKRKIA
jgi:YgiT-type zinc finger domain-containing protein